MKRIAFAVAVIALSGCASIVRKPDIDRVKKVAILSVYGNSTVPEAKNRGVVSGWDASFRMEVADTALKISEAEITKLGWQVVPGGAIVQSPDYQQTFNYIEPATGSEKVDGALGAIGGFIKDLKATGYFAPPGMHPIQLASEQGSYSKCYGNNCPPDPKAKLAEFAKKMGVDAVVIVSYDYCYEGGTWSLGGTGEAKMTAAATIRAVGPDGQMLVDMPKEERCKGETRTESENSMFMNKGNLIFLSASKDKMKAMFAQATDGSTKKAVGMLYKAMH